MTVTSIGRFVGDDSGAITIDHTILVAGGIGAVMAVSSLVTAGTGDAAWSITKMLRGIYFDALMPADQFDGLIGGYFQAHEKSGYEMLTGQLSVDFIRNSWFTNDEPRTKDHKIFNVSYYSNVESNMGTIIEEGRDYQLGTSKNCPARTAVA